MENNYITRKLIKNTKKYDFYDNLGIKINKMLYKKHTQGKYYTKI